jgi:hypothetical protein
VSKWSNVYNHLFKKNTIVLTSQTLGSPDGFEIHGIFPSFSAASLHVAKDMISMHHEEAITLFRTWKESNDKCEIVLTTFDDQEIHWCASRQPIRSESGL